MAKRRRRSRSQQKHIDTQAGARAALEAEGWEYARTSKKGYVAMRCPFECCQCMLPKTPSNPNKYDEIVAYQLKQCDADRRRSSDRE